MHGVNEVRRTGCVLQASYRTLRGVPVVQCYGLFEDGSSFLVQDDRERPFFYITRRAAERADSLLRGRDVRWLDDATVGLHGEPLRKAIVAVPQDVPPLRDRLHAAGIPTFEADVRFAQRYLIDRGIRGGIAVTGTPRPGDGVDWLFDCPQVEPAEVVVTPRVLSFDIETTPDAKHVLAIALYAETADAAEPIDEVLLVHRRPEPPPPRAIAYRDERALLQAFCERVRTIDPDVLTGWNVIDFDLEVLAKVAARVGVTLRLGRGPGALRIRRAERFMQRSEAFVPGRLVLDGIALLQGAFVRMEEYGLDAVAREVLGEGKTIGNDEGDRAAAILQRYVEDRAAFVDYARTDARLVVRILSTLGLVDLAFARSRLTGMTPDRVAASIASFDFLYLGELHRRGIAAPTVGADVLDPTPQAGGFVLEPEPGLYRDVLVFDFKSLYPSIIRTFGIDPLGYRATVGPDDDLVLAPNGAAFAREPAILPGLLDALFPMREAAKRRGDATASQAIKILMNSFYGVLGTPACRFHNPAIANAITAFGKALLLWAKAWFEARGLRVLYGDTDSLFVLAAPNGAQAGGELAGALNDALGAYVAAEWRVPSRLELEYEKRYLRLLLPAVRGGTAGARKRYAGLVADSAEGHLEFTGMEVVRRDWTALAKVVQRELYARLFADDDIEGWLQALCAAVRAGDHDDELVYRKALRKPLTAYTENTPPHVAAARKLVGPVPRTITYVMTVAGPEPIGAVASRLDREHYLDKQVRPVAEPVLALRGLDFARISDAPRQASLF